MCTNWQRHTYEYRFTEETFSLKLNMLPSYFPPSSLSADRVLIQSILLIILASTRLVAGSRMIYE